MPVAYEPLLGANGFRCDGDANADGHTENKPAKMLRQLHVSLQTNSTHRACSRGSVK